MKLTTVICFLLLLTSITQAQEKDKYGRPPLVPGIAELKIGDQVPDILIDNIINIDKRSIRTSDYKDRLLVLDFWERSCGTCIASMPKLDSLQRVFGDQIKLLSVTWESEANIVDFFKKNRFLKEYNPPVHRASAVDDRILRSYFRYQTNPHVIWIYKGKVMAITGYEHISSTNIQEVLDGKTVSWPLKNDSFDPMYPLMRLDGLSEEVRDSPYYGYSVLTGTSNSMQIGLGGLFFKQDTVRNCSRLAFFNQDLSSIYQILLYATKPSVTMEDMRKDATKRPYIPHPARRILEVKDVSRFRNDRQEDKVVWDSKNHFCYEMEKQGRLEKQALAKQALTDLNNRFYLNGRYEKRKVKCLVFVKTDKPLTDTLPKGKGGMSIPALVMMSLDYAQKYPPAIDETGLGYNVEFNIMPDDGTLAGFRKEIQRHGLDLIEAEREIEVLVISDAK
ncbi:redoxin domain-containing protein [Sphingobacterium kitahiroshimense]|uniref:TlpA family protein disulfide reductase n=1 Tax=Sphingobacterium sp. B16(2022) TaxID=2914044 RepID=UPI00143B0AD8|nr:redoxin domain-containing protein [Sphingobacterium sp. B16(2022)]NJI74037.1 redoxin domain-containing protein [Sphingobacterium sp. B16(2022)]